MSKESGTQLHAESDSRERVKEGKGAGGDVSVIHCVNAIMQLYASLF